MPEVPDTPRGVRAFFRRRLLVGGRIAEPGCGRCGYPVRGLAGTVCPECGADRRVVGVMDPNRTPRALGTLGLLASWAAVLLFLAWVGNDALLPLTPRRLSNQRDYALWPASREYEYLQVRRIGYGWGWNTRPWIPRSPEGGSIKLTRGIPGPYYEMKADFSLAPPTLSYVITFDTMRGTAKTPVASQMVTLDQQGMLSWMEHLDIDVTRPEVRAEAAELLALLTAPDFAPAHHERLQHFIVEGVAGGPKIVAKRHGQRALNTAWLLVGTAGAAWILWSRRPGRVPHGTKVAEVEEVARAE